MFKSALLSLAAAFAFSAPAFSQVVVNGGGLAKDCFDKAKYNDPGKKSTIRICEKALLDFDLQGKNKAATHINTAILYMRRGDYGLAHGHYEKAIAIRPKLSEAYISLAANHIYQGEYDAALTAVNTGIDLGTKKMPEALYNRAMVYDHLKKYNLAYKDLQKALTLRPDWEIAVKALGNYEVVSQPG